MNILSDCCQTHYNLQWKFITLPRVKKDLEVNRGKL